MARKKLTPPKLVLEATMDECLALYAAGLRSVGYPVGSPAARRRMRSNIERALRFALKKGGILRFLRNKKGTLIAAIVARPGSYVSAHRFSDAHSCFDFYSAPGPAKRVRETNAWFVREFTKIRPLLTSNVDTFIETWQAPVLPALARLGVHAVGLSLQGRIPLGLVRLKRRYPKIEAELAASPYTIRPIRTRAEVEAYLDVVRKEFRRNPQFGWFVAAPVFIDQLRQEMRASLGRRNRCAWIFVHREKIVGGFDYYYGKENRFYGNASLGLNLAHSAQGKGLARFAYWVGLQAMAKAGARYFQGATAQPGVLKLARVMGRKCTGIEILASRKPYFPRGHFNAWIRELARNPL